MVRERDHLVKLRSWRGPECHAPPKTVDSHRRYSVVGFTTQDLTVVLGYAEKPSTACVAACLWAFEESWEMCYGRQSVVANGRNVFSCFLSRTNAYTSHLDSRVVRGWGTNILQTGIRERKSSIQEARMTDMKRINGNYDHTIEKYQYHRILTKWRIGLHSL